MTRINLISCPRNISTALMYAFAQRSDTQVVDEPFYGYYLSMTGADHPGKDEIIAAMEPDPKKVVETLLSFNDKPVLFIKNMAHHLIDIEERLYRSFVNIFFIRDPMKIIASYAQVRSNPTMTDIGIKQLHELYQYIQQLGQQPPIVDSGELLKNPKQMLQHLCERVGILFEESMLSWKPGPKPYDGVWAKYWYENVHRSTGFEPQATRHRPLPEHLLPLYHEALPYYQELYEQSIKV